MHPTSPVPPRQRAFPCLLANISGSWNILNQVWALCACCNLVCFPLLRNFCTLRKRVLTGLLAASEFRFQSTARIALNIGRHGEERWRQWNKLSPPYWKSLIHSGKRFRIAWRHLKCSLFTCWVFWVRLIFECATLALRLVPNGTVSSACICL